MEESFERARNLAFGGVRNDGVSNPELAERTPGERKLLLSYSRRELSRRDAGLREAREAGEMPEDMLNALDILDAAADAQVARDKALEPHTTAQPKKGSIAVQSKKGSIARARIG